MRLLQRNRHDQADRTDDDYYDERPLPDEAPEPQPERGEPTLVKLDREPEPEPAAP